MKTLTAEEVFQKWNDIYHSGSGSGNAHDHHIKAMEEYAINYYENKIEMLNRVAERRELLNLDSDIEILFKNSEGKTAKIGATVKDLLNKTTDDLNELLDETSPCTSASCNNESNNHCDCGSIYEDYQITGITLPAPQGYTKSQILKVASDAWDACERHINYDEERDGNFEPPNKEQFLSSLSPAPEQEDANQ